MVYDIERRTDTSNKKIKIKITIKLIAMKEGSYPSCARVDGDDQDTHAETKPGLLFRFNDD